MKNILAFETSCDDTAVAIVNEAGRVLGAAMFSQLKEHAPFGGVVPEIGSRAHIEQILLVTKEAFSKASMAPGNIDAVAATFAPGLIGPLLVGAQFAKGFAVARKIPLIAVHHIEGHILAGLSEKDFPEPPFLALIASGGHSAIYLCAEDLFIKKVGDTLDDAAGEAFDKIGRALGLPYPAGKIIDELATEGDAQRFTFPQALKDRPDFNFSFSGLKTSAINRIANSGPFDRKALADFCAGLQEAVATSLTTKLMLASDHHKINSLVIGGGVAANSRLRALCQEKAESSGRKLFLPHKSLCTDNAIMIGRAATIKFRHKQSAKLDCDVMATLAIDDKHRLG